MVYSPCLFFLFNFLICFSHSCNILWLFMSTIPIASPMALIIVRPSTATVRICACQRRASMNAVHLYRVPVPPVLNLWKTDWCVLKIVSTKKIVDPIYTLYVCMYYNNTKVLQWNHRLYLIYYFNFKLFFTYFFDAFTFVIVNCLLRFYFFFSTFWFSKNI